MEILNLDELAQDRAYEFLFVLAPLLLRGGIGVPINPIAIREDMRDDWRGVRLAARPGGIPMDPAPSTMHTRPSGRLQG
jgi:hypothetical protein